MNDQSLKKNKNSKQYTCTLLNKSRLLHSWLLVVLIPMPFQTRSIFEPFAALYTDMLMVI